MEPAILLLFLLSVSHEITPAAAQSIQVSVGPTGATLQAGSSLQFTPAVYGSTNQAVTWSVNTINGGNATVGTISSTGIYLAPNQLPVPNVVTIRATSVADSSASASTTLNLVNAPVSVTSVEPAQVNANKPLSFKVIGNAFATGAKVTIGGHDLVTTFISTTELRATGAANLLTPAAYPLMVTNPNPGTSSWGVGVTVLPAVSVFVTPTAMLRTLQTAQLEVQVNYASNTSVTWTVNGILGGNATVGTVSTGGLYTAPAVVPAAGTVSVKATSVADPTASGTCTVSLNNPIVTVTSVVPAQINVNTSFSFKVSGTNFINGAKVTLGGNELVTTYVSSTELRATGTTNVQAPVGLVLMVTNPLPGPTSAGLGITVLPSISVFVPTPASLRSGQTAQLEVYVNNTSDKRVTWKVDGILGGNATVGTVSTGGLYTAPAVVPALGTVSIKATSVADPTASATCTVTLLNAIPVITLVTPASVNIGSFNITVDGTGFATGAQIKFGSITLTTTRVSSTRLTGSGTSVPVIGGRVALSVSNPNPGGSISNIRIIKVQTANPRVTTQAAARFLEQASWGPDPESIARVQEVGFSSYLDEQFAAPMSDYPEPPVSDEMQGLSPAQRRFFTNGLTGKDQLRQRVAFALSQIFVVSALKSGTARSMVPYLRLLHANAFGTYVNLVGEVTINPTMGYFLDMVNNNTLQGTAPNENYARELLQLFTIGPVKLNRDGSTQLDAGGVPIPAYNQADIANLARALTGWTFPSITGGTPTSPNPPYFEGAMVAFPLLHDTSSKTFLDGYVLPAGQSAGMDLASALVHICDHPNVGPFVARRLIQHLVTSNPSAAYVDRIASVFNSDSGGQRGNLRSVVKAILLDTEARQGDTVDASLTQGHLREPVYFVLSLLRAIKATVPEEHALSAQAADMGQRLFFAPSVFNYFSLTHRIPSSGLVGPEYQILTPSTALIRANFVDSLVFGLSGSPAVTDLTSLSDLAAQPDELVEALNHALMHGQMSQSMRNTIVTTITPLSNNQVRAQTALYLVASSSQYQVLR